MSPIDFALVATGLGERDAAISALNEAFDIRDPYLPLTVIDPALDSLRSDPRFEDLLTRMHLSPEAKRWARRMVFLMRCSRQLETATITPSR